MRDLVGRYQSLREDHVRYLVKCGVIRPVLRTNADVFFAFPDLAIIKQVSGEVENGASFRSVVRALVAARLGQLAFDFRIDAAPAKIITLKRPAAGRSKPETPAAGSDWLRSASPEPSRRAVVPARVPVEAEESSEMLRSTERHCTRPVYRRQPSSRAVYRLRSISSTRSICVASRAASSRAAPLATPSAPMPLRGRRRRTKRYALMLACVTTINSVFFGLSSATIRYASRWPAAIAL